MFSIKENLIKVKKYLSMYLFPERALFLILPLCFLYRPSFSVEYILPPDDISVIGDLKLIQAKEDETLLDIARQYGVGRNEIVMANPNVDEWYPGEGTPVVIPTRYILPNAPRKGVVMNLAEMRIYYYPKTKKGELPKVITYPVGIGRMDWETPLGRTKVIQKKINPSWTPPASIHKEHIEKGDPLPRVVPPGPDNPLGSRALRLGIPGYLIHGTNKPYGVGMRVSHGCVRMRQEDIEELYDVVPNGERVNIINQSLKVGWFGDEIFMEYHPPLQDSEVEKKEDYHKVIEHIKEEFPYDKLSIEDNVIKALIEEKSGIPVSISFKKKL